MPTSAARYFHVDVFASGPLAGNGLVVFMNTDGWSTQFMQNLTREMRQFESIFLSEISRSGARARVFTVDEELPFAGHPILGAASVLHRTQAPLDERSSWLLRLSGGDVHVDTARMDAHHLAEMNQGPAQIGTELAAVELQTILTRIGLTKDDMADGFPTQVVSTGLPYLIVPVRRAGLARAAIAGDDLERLLAPIGAKFILVLDVEGFEMRTWDNLGRVEDVATGSAAGPAAAYLFRLGLHDADLPLVLSQGRFAGRPSQIRIRSGALDSLVVSGEVWPVAHGVLDFAERESAGM